MMAPTRTCCCPCGDAVPPTLAWLAESPAALDPAAAASDRGFLYALLNHAFASHTVPELALVGDVMVERAQRILVEAPPGALPGLLVDPLFVARLLRFSLTGHHARPTTDPGGAGHDDLNPG